MQLCMKRLKKKHHTYLLKHLNLSYFKKKSNIITGLRPFLACALLHHYIKTLNYVLVRIVLWPVFKLIYILLGLKQLKY